MHHFVADSSCVSLESLVALRPQSKSLSLCGICLFFFHSIRSLSLRGGTAGSCVAFFSLPRSITSTSHGDQHSRRFFFQLGEYRMFFLKKKRVKTHSCKFKMGMYKTIRLEYIIITPKSLKALVCSADSTDVSFTFLL